jgi:hypothetical protein
MINYFIHLSNPICTGLVSEAFEALRKLHLEKVHGAQSTYEI